MNAMPLILRLILINSLLIGAFAATPDAAVQAHPSQAVILSVSNTPDQTSPMYLALDKKWSIKVRNWAKPFKRGGQDRIDRCQATLWSGSFPRKNAQSPTWLAGHNYCGFWRWDKWLAVGSQFSIKGPTGQVHQYTVYRRKYLDRKGGSSAGLIHGDITLQTCRGSGTSFVYANRTKAVASSGHVSPHAAADHAKIRTLTAQLNKVLAYDTQLGSELAGMEDLVSAKVAELAAQEVQIAESQAEINRLQAIIDNTPATESVTRGGVNRMATASAADAPWGGSAGVARLYPPGLARNGSSDDKQILTLTAQLNKARARGAELAAELAGTKELMSATVTHMTSHVGQMAELQAEIDRLQALIDEPPSTEIVTEWGANYMATASAGEAMWGGRADVGRIYFQGLAGHRLSTDGRVKRAIADGVRHLAISYKDTNPANAQAFLSAARADITAGVLPRDLKVDVTFRHEPENDTNADPVVWRQQWAQMSPIIRQNGFRAGPVLMAWTLASGSGRDLEDWTLPKSLVDFCGFDMYFKVMGELPDAVEMAEEYGVPLAIWETGAPKSSTRTADIRRYRPQLDGVADVVIWWDDADPGFDAGLADDPAAIDAFFGP